MARSGPTVYNSVVSTRGLVKIAVDVNVHVDVDVDIGVDVDVEMEETRRRYNIRTNYIGLEICLSV